MQPQRHLCLSLVLLLWQLLLPLLLLLQGAAAPVTPACAVIGAIFPPLSIAIYSNGTIGSSSGSSSSLSRSSSNSSQQG